MQRKSHSTKATSKPNVAQSKAKVTKVLYKKGTVLAYIDPTADDPSFFRLCVPVANVQPCKEEFAAHIFQRSTKKSLKFARVQEKKPASVLVNTVVSPIDAPTSVLPESVTLSKKEADVVSKAIPVVMKALESDSSDDEEEKPAATTKVGQKRSRAQVTAAAAVDSSDEEAAKVPAAKRARNTSQGRSSSVIVPAKEPKPLPFKRGKWNPDITIHDYEPMKQDKSTSLQRFCCRRCACRDAHRAAFTGNYELLKKCLFDKENVMSVNAAWGPDDVRTPFNILYEQGHLGPKSKFLELMMHPSLPDAKKLKHDQLQAEIDSLFSRNNRQCD